MELGKSLWHDGATNGMRFFPASNPKIHYMGRWTATKNRMRKDGAFPGAYLDIRVNGTARVYLELGNEGQGRRKVREKYRKAEEQMEAWAHLEFQERPGEKPAKPISILSRVDEEEYVLLPNASHLISLTGSGLSSNTHHDIRVIVPMIGGDETNVAQVAGVWLDKAGSLLRIEGSPLDEEIDDEDIQKAESDTIGKKHREGLSDLSKWRNDDEEEEVPVERRKVVEIITDTPNRPKPDHHGRYGGGHGLLAGVMGWEFLLGEMFGIDHVSTGVDGMCLTQDCIGGTAEPVSMADVFFRR